MNKIGIKRSLTNFDLEINKKELLTNKENNILDFPYNTKNKNKKNKYLRKSITNKTKTKDKESITHIYLTKYRYSDNNNDRVRIYNSQKNYQLLIDKKNKNKNKKNYRLGSIKNYSSVDKIKNRINIHNYNNKIIKINNLFRSSTIDLSNKNSVIKKNNHFITNLTKYLHSLDNTNYNVTANSSTFLKKTNYNRRQTADLFNNIISPKSYTLRGKSNSNLNKKIYNSNNNLHIKIKNQNYLDDENYHIYVEDNNNQKNPYNELNKDNNYIYKKSINKLENYYKDKFIDIIEKNILLYKNLKTLKNENKKKKKKFNLTKEKYLYTLQKKNIIEHKNKKNDIYNYIHVNINCKINNKIIPKINLIKEKELNIYQTLFNISINNNDIYTKLTNDRIQKENENRLICLLLGLLKNVVNHYGNITQIFNDNVYKKRHLFFLLINNGIEINNKNIINLKLKDNNKKNEINNKYRIKEIKEEIEEEENDEEESEEKKLNISIIYKKDNIIEKLLINDFPLKYNNITDKKFVKLSYNEYIFNNEIKVLAFYKDDKVFLQIENDNIINYSNDNDNEYSLDEFVSKFVKNKDILNKNKKYLSPIYIKRDKMFYPQNDKKSKFNNYIDILERNGVKRKKLRKKNICVEKYSRNHKIINEIEYNQEDFKKRFLNEQILLANNSFINDSNNNLNVKENKPVNENESNTNTNEKK